YCGSKGIFYIAEYSPCSRGDFRPLKNSGFMLFTKREGTVKTLSHLRTPALDGRIDDDAIYPIYTANLMGTNSVSVKLLGFSPIEFDSIDFMCLPYAFFEITIKNNASTEVEVACALKIPALNTIAKEEKGFQISSDTVERAVFASSSTSDAIVSVGSYSDSSFFKNGKFSDTLFSDSIIAIAVKVSLGGREEKKLHFVYSWYNKLEPERYYYTNIIKEAKDAATIGLTQFDRLHKNSIEIVNRMRGSNFPEWLKDQTLNSLCNLTTNSIYTKDGRHCFTEGMWDVNGTLDQMWHARQIMIMTIPQLVWKELEWWARTQKIDPVGQIHHDMGNPMSELWGWDDKQHPEYDYEPNCDNWVDLNCAFIISIYETFCATGDTAKLNYFWPYIKKTAKRILDQLNQYGDQKYKYTFSSTRNTYDQPGIEVDYYNTSLSTVTYKILTIFCDIYGDTTLKKVFQEAFENVRISFKERYLSGNFTPQRFTEALLAGQWMGFFLKFGQFYSQSDVDYALDIMDNYYNPLEKGLGFPTGSYE
ncbi:MAG: GH116 family glycosyl hydrolase, partial [Chitinispirillaceae bacterium]|nr:GH116 family glycosyl hydrolase [Chitinispirillaceae bacterium]